MDAPEEQRPSAQYLTELEQQLKAKDELIEKLRRDLIDHCCETPDAEDASEGRRKDRSVLQLNEPLGLGGWNISLIINNGKQGNRVPVFQYHRSNSRFSVFMKV